MYRSFLLVLSFSLCVFSKAQPISPDSLKSLMTNGSPYDFLLIDCRDTSETSSMIGNNVCKPYNLPWPTRFDAECGKIGKDQIVVLYCLTGHRSQSAAAHLDSLNYTHVYTAGGISSWTGPTISKTQALPIDSLPEPSMKGTISSVTYKQPAHRNRSVAVKTFIPHTFLSLYVNKGQVLFNLTGREIVGKAAGLLGKTECENIANRK